MGIKFQEALAGESRGTQDATGFFFGARTRRETAPFYLEGTLVVLRSDVKEPERCGPVCRARCDLSPFLS